MHLILRRLFLPLLLAASLPVLSGCVTAGPKQEPLALTILHINDHHSHLDAETTQLRLKDAAGEDRNVTLELGGFARVSAAMAELAAPASNVLKLHAGDALTGDLYYTQSEGAADAAMMNTVCFDAFALGNHEFDNRDAGLVKFIDFLHARPAECNTPVLSANVRPAPGSALASRIRPWTVVERGGQKIGIVGLTVGNKTRNASRPDPTTSFLDEAGSAQQAIDELRAAGIDKIVLLSHQGYQVDLAMAPRLSGVDVIVGGDSHTLLGPDGMAAYGLTPAGAYPTQASDRDGKRVCIVQAWQYSYAVGELKVDFDAKGEVTACSGTPHVLVGDAFSEGSTAATAADAASYRRQLATSGTLRITTPSAAAAAVLAPFKAAKRAIDRQPVGRSTERLCLRRVPGGQRDTTRSELGDACNLDPHVVAHGGDIQQLVAEAFLEQGRHFGGADIALQNAGGVREDIPAGDITLGKVYELLPFRNLLVRLTLDGDEVRAMLEDGVDSVLHGTGTGAYPYAASLRFDVDMNRAKGARISALEFRNADGSWRPFDASRSYRVITSNFVAEGGDGYPSLKAIPASRREDTFLDYADSFVQYVRARSPLARPAATEYSTRRYIETR
ncbi:MAG: bifunctional metallophosphatase/5'-nucleotidase [Zoogloea sp.]|nr:bifunctional metallophosphatase/5'-nucleotidase [Zoogloea sp.]